MLLDAGRAGAGRGSGLYASVCPSSNEGAPQHIPLARQCRAFLAQRRGATHLRESTKSDRRDGGLKMDWTKPRAGCSHLWAFEWLAESLREAKEVHGTKPVGRFERQTEGHSGIWKAPTEATGPVIGGSACGWTRLPLGLGGAKR